MLTHWWRYYFLVIAFTAERSTSSTRHHYSRQLYVDAEFGVDSVACLSSNQQQQQQQQQRERKGCCKTINYTVTNAPSETTINIVVDCDGAGITNSTKNHFALNGTIEVSKNLTIKAYSGLTCRPIITKNTGPVQFAFSLGGGGDGENKGHLIEINLNLVGLDFQGVNIVNCQDESVMCNVHIDQCKAIQCEGCSAKFVDIRTAMPTYLSISNSSFQSDGYSIRILSKDASLSISNVTLVSGSQIYIKNTNTDKKVSVRIRDLHTTGSFPLYAAHFVGHFKELVLQEISMLDTTFARQGLRVQFYTDNKVKSNVTLRDVVVQNTTNSGTDLFSFENCVVNVTNITVIRSKLTIAIKVTRSVGNLSDITAATGSYMMLLVAVLQSEASVAKVNVSNCYFESVTFRDNRLGGRYSPYRHKGLIFLEYSTGYLSDFTVTGNHFGWHFVYSTDSEVLLTRVVLSKNKVDNEALELADRVGFVIHDFVIEGNQFKSTVFNVFHNRRLIVSDMLITDNFVEQNNFSYFTIFRVLQTPVELRNVVVRYNVNIKVFVFHHCEIQVFNLSILHNKMYYNLMTATYGSFAAFNVTAANNTVSTNIKDTGTVEGSAMVFDNVDVSIIKDLNIANNMLRNAISCLSCIRFNMDTCHIAGNVIKQKAISHTDGGDLVIKNVQIVDNKMQSGLLVQHAGALIESFHFENNTITGFDTRVMLLDGFDKRDEKQVEMFRDNKTNLITYIHNVMMKDVFVVDHENKNRQEKLVSASITLITYFAKFTMMNVSLVISGHQELAMDIPFPIDTIDNKNEISNYSVNCPVGSQIIHHTKSEGVRATFGVFCPKCPLHFYTMASSSFTFASKHFESDLERGKVFGFGIQNVQQAECHLCPLGGVCEDGLVVSKSNYYGFVSRSSGGGIASNQKQLVEYVTCPVEYCCSKSGKQCTSFNTCNYHRHGLLCGECDPGYQVSFFTEQCISSAKCTQKTKFWIMFGMVVLGFAFVLCFMDNIKMIVLILPKTIIQTLICHKKNKGGFRKQQQQQQQLEHQRHRNIYTITKETVLGGGIKNLAYDESEKRYDGSNNIDDQNKVETEADHFTEKAAKDTPPYTWQGIFNCLLSFYQIKSLLNVNGAMTHGRDSILERYLTKLTDLFNLEIFINVYSQEFCPMTGLNAISKQVIRVLLLNAAAAVSVIAIWLVCLLYNTTVATKRKKQGKSLSELFLLKLEVCLLRIITFGYKNVASVAVTFLTCIDINGKFYLFIEASVQCFTYQQYVVFAFLGLWVIPMPVNLYVAFNWYHDQVVSFREFLFCLVFPPVAGVYWCVELRRRAANQKIEHNHRQFARIREMYEEPYRPRNMGGVEVGNSKETTTDTNDNTKYVFWEHWRLMQRLMLSIVTSYLKNPIYKIYMSSPLLLLFFAVYLKIKPFKRSLFVLHWLEVASLIGVCYQLLYNLLKSYLYLYDVPNKTHEELLLAFFRYTEFLFTPLFLFVVYLVGSRVLRFLKRNLFNRKEQYCVAN